MKVLCLPYSHTLSHLSRPLAVASELRDRGHEVSFAGESRNIAFIKSRGFKVYPLYEPDPEILYDNIRQGKLRFICKEEVEKLVKEDLLLFYELQPDIVITDGRFSAPISTSIYKTKHCAIVNVSSTEFRALPYIPFFDWIPKSLRSDFVENALDRFNLALEMFIFDNAMRVFKTLSHKHGLAKKVTATNCLAGNDLTLLADVPEYFPARNLPENYHYIGPLTWKSKLPEPSWWPFKGTHRGIIYLTMGTTGISDFFPKVYDLFKKSRYPAIITTGGQSMDLDSITGKLYIENFIDGDLAMGACDMVVCHGGNGTIYQALQHGKPIIGIPSIPDQKFNMRRVESLGVGKMLSWKDFLNRPEYLLELIDSIYSKKLFFERTSAFREVLNAYDPAKRAADIIEKEFSHKCHQ